MGFGRGTPAPAWSLSLLALGGSALSRDFRFSTVFMRVGPARGT
jgi:hypothetical protein